MSENVRRWKWTLSKRIAAMRVADDRLSNAEIAQEAGVTERQLQRWNEIPEFAAFVTELQSDVAEALKHLLTTTKERRIAILEDLLTLQMDIIKARQADPNTASAGIETGLLVRQWKKIGSGQDAEMVEEYSVDSTLVTSITNTLKRVSEELGQNETKITVGGSIRHTHIKRDYSALSDAELASLEALAEKIETGKVTV